VGLTTACAVLGIPRSSLYRQIERFEKPREDLPKPRPAPDRALTREERIQVRDILNSDRFQDASPRQVWARLLDESTYLCSWRSMYRILDEYDEVRERRDLLRHPAYTKPELLAEAPNQLWSWDITKLRGPFKGIYYYLYVILDVFSRYGVGWMVAGQESKALAYELIEETCRKEGVCREQLVLHADRGPAMKAKTVALLLSNLGVGKSHSRPHVPDDNPYSEAQFKTMKYRPDYPDRFGCVEDARVWARGFFEWYHHQHFHTGLGLMTPAAVHFGQAGQIRIERQRVLDLAYTAHPERFVRGKPVPPALPTAVWINPPKTELPDQVVLH